MPQKCRFPFRGDVLYWNRRCVAKKPQRRFNVTTSLTLPVLSTGMLMRVRQLDDRRSTEGDAKRRRAGINGSYRFLIINFCTSRASFLQVAPHIGLKANPAGTLVRDHQAVVPACVQGRKARRSSRFRIRNGRHRARGVLGETR